MQPLDQRLGSFALVERCSDVGRDQQLVPKPCRCDPDMEDAHDVDQQSHRRKTSSACDDECSRHLLVSGDRAHDVILPRRDVTELDPT